jgi:hypothetical protein
MVKLGRKLLKPIFQHWAVQVRGKWYEIAGGSCSSRQHFGAADDSNEINDNINPAPAQVMEGPPSNQQQPNQKINEGDLRFI